MSDKFQKIVATGVLIMDGKALLVRRSAKETFMAGHYECAGGKVDFGEDPRVALAREYMEETGLVIEVGDPIETISYISQQGQRHTVEIFFRVSLRESSSNEVKLSEDHDTYLWATMAELDNLDPDKKDVILNVVRRAF